MTQKYKKTLFVVFMAATIAAGVASGYLMKLLVIHERGNYIDFPGGIMMRKSETAVVMMMFIIVYLSCVLLIMLYGTGKSRLNREYIDTLRDAGTTQLHGIKNAVSELQHDYEQSQKTCKAKSRFLNRMSHDLRTPMNAIIGYSMLIERFADDPEKTRYYSKKISLSGQTLMELINDALDMSCIESGNLKLVKNDFSLLATFDEVTAAMKPQMESKNQQFNFYISNTAKIDQITGDKQKLCQIMRNLLSNASKYTDEGGSIDMIVNILRSGKDVQMLCQIKDTGCGMSSDFMKVMFQPFEREEHERNDSSPGTGLGLSIAKNFTEMMDGELTVESQQGKGTLVTIRVPIVAAAGVEPVIPHDISAGGILDGLNVLVAEDNELNAEIIGEVLHAMDADCTITENGSEAVSAFEKSLPGEYDIILMDIQMPIMNGYQAAAAIRRSIHPDASDIAIIAMTADAFEEDVQKAFVSGMNAHVAKPLDLQAFINTVSSLMIKNKAIS